MMLWKTSTLVALLSAVPQISARGGAAWQGWDKYVPYPDSAGTILNETTALLGPLAPQVVVYDTLPSSDSMLEHLQEVAIRNSNQNNLFHLDVNYVLMDGLDLGCRVPAHAQAITDAAANGTRLTDHVPATNMPPFCKHHCTHEGRYCPAYTPSQLAARNPHNGRDLVKEMLRRLCLGHNLYHKFAHYGFFVYFHFFDAWACMDRNPNTTNLELCSHSVLTSKYLSHIIDVAEHSPYAKCVAAKTYEADYAHPMLERMLDVSYSMNYEIAELPVLEFNGNDYADTGGAVRADSLLSTWCGYFADSPLNPISCDYCQNCDYEKTCLWTLQCGKHDFNIDTYKEPFKAQQTPTQQVEEVVVQGTERVLGYGILLGMSGMAVLWALVEMKRRRAIQQVQREMPKHGYKDSTELPKMT